MTSPTPDIASTQDQTPLTGATISGHAPELMPGLINYNTLNEAAAYVKSKWPNARPQVAIILGSGWGPVAEAFTIKDKISYAEIPGLGATTAPGHEGTLLLAEMNGVEVLLFKGRVHGYEGRGWTPIAIPVAIAKELDAQDVCFCSAVGGAREDLQPGDIMVVEDHASTQGQNPLMGTHNNMLGPRFPDMSSIYTKELREVAEQASQISGVPIKSGRVGVYDGGPTFETPLEVSIMSNRLATVVRDMATQMSRMADRISVLAPDLAADLTQDSNAFKEIAARAYECRGVDTAGMSGANGEAIIASAAGLRVISFNCIANLAAGLSENPLTEAEVIETLHETLPRLNRLFGAFFKLYAEKWPAARE